MTLLYKAWGDEKFANEEDDYESAVDANGIKYTIQYRLNEHGRKIRITRKVRVTKKTLQVVNKRVEERKTKWVKFGRVKGVEGIEQGATYRGEEVFLVMGDEEERKAERDRREQLARDTKELETLYQSLLSDHLDKSSTMTSSSPTPWRPRNHLTLATNSTVSSSLEDDKSTTIKISNLSDETTDDDLRELLRDYGRVSKSHIVRNRETNLSRGFAFINFHQRRDAEIAMEKLNGYGWNHLILSVEWAKPSVK